MRFGAIDANRDCGFPPELPFLQSRNLTTAAGRQQWLNGSVILLHRNQANLSFRSEPIAPYAVREVRGDTALGSPFLKG